MNIDDFRCMRQGRAVRQLQLDELKDLAAFERSNGKHNRALLLIHGYTSTPAVFRHYLADLDCYDGVYAPILPGHVDSIEAFSKSTALQWSEAMNAYAKRLSGKYQQLDVLGLSLGGILAWQIARLYPVRHLFLLAPAFDLRANIPWALKMARFFSYLGFKNLFSGAGNICDPKGYEIAYRKTPISTIIEILGFIQSLDFSLPNCSTDVFVGEHDLVVDSEAVAARFEPFVNMTVHWLENSAHVLPVDINRQAVLECIQARCKA